MTDLNSIKARLGSISDTAMSKLPKAVQTLLREDLPRLVEVAELTMELLNNHEEARGTCKDCLDYGLGTHAEQIESKISWPPSPEQQIKEIPW